jgi:hypothetical protein
MASCSHEIHDGWNMAGPSSVLGGYVITAELGPLTPARQRRPALKMLTVVDMSIGG